MTSILSRYIAKKYPNSKSDLFAVFIERSAMLLKANGFRALITMQSWMFLKSYEKMRLNILEHNEICSLLYLGIKAFEEIGNDIVQTASFVIRNSSLSDYTGTCLLYTSRCV